MLGLTGDWMMRKEQEKDISNLVQIKLNQLKGFYFTFLNH